MYYYAVSVCVHLAVRRKKLNSFDRVKKAKQQVFTINERIEDLYRSWWLNIIRKAPNINRSRNSKSSKGIYFLL